MIVINKYKAGYTHYIGRGTLLGNPYVIDKDGTRDEVIAMYEKYALKDPEVLDAIEALPESAILGCFCKPKHCHGDVIIKIWNKLHRVGAT